MMVSLMFKQKFHKLYAKSLDKDHYPKNVLIGFHISKIFF